MLESSMDAREAITAFREERNSTRHCYVVAHQTPGDKAARAAKTPGIPNTPPPG